MAFAFYFIGLSLGLTFAGAAFAQQRTDPGQAERNIDAYRQEQKRAKPSLRLPTVERPEIHADTKPLFKLTRVSIEGAKVIPREALAETYRPYIGKQVSQADLVAIAEKISDQYREAGFHLSRAIIPPQDIQTGRVRVRVIEGWIADIVLKGDAAGQFGVRPIFDPIAAERPARLATLERQLLIINDRPGVRIADTNLEEIGKTSGAFRLTVAVETWHIYVSTALENWGSPASGPLQSFFFTAFNSSFVAGDTLGFDLATVPDSIRELRFGRLSYDAPVGIDGARFGFSGSYGEVDPGDDRRLLNTRDVVENFEFRSSVMPLQTRLASLRLTATAGFTNDTETDMLGTNYKDRVRTVALIADYKRQDDFGGTNYLTLGFRQGLNIFGASEKDDPLLSRSDGSGTFSKAEFWFTRYQKLADPWSLRFSAAGQWASRPLLQSQEFFIGGPAFGRGYDSGETSGDKGIAASLELRYDQGLKNPVLTGYQLYSFVEHGTVWNFAPGPEIATSLSSVGTGVRLYFANDFQAGVGVGFPLDYRSPTNFGRDPRIFFSVSKSFKTCPEWRPNTGCL